MMKIAICLLFFILAAFEPIWPFGLVVDGTARDTLSIPFAPLDSIGNPVDLASGDSVYIVVFSPGGTVVHADSMAFNDASIKSYNWEDFSGGRAYVYTEQVSDLVGSSVSNGAFSYILDIQDNSSADLITRYSGSFQTLNAPLDCLLDSAAYAQKAFDSLETINDSLFAVLDSLQNQDNWAVDSAEVTGAVIAALNADTTAHFSLLHVKSNRSDSAAFLVYNAADDAVHFKSDGYNSHALWAEADTGNGVLITSEAVCGLGIVTYADSGNAVHFSAPGPQLGANPLVGLKIDGPSSGIFYGMQIVGSGTFGDAGRFELTSGTNGNVLSLHNNGVGDVVQYRANDGQAIDADAGILIGDTAFVTINGSQVPLAIMPDQWSSDDSSAYQGSASGLDSGSVYGALAQAIGDSALTAGSGRGAYSYSIIAYDSSAGQIVPGVDLSVRNIDQTALIAIGETDLSGRATFNLDADSFIVIGYSPGYIFESYDSIYVSSSGADTLLGYQFNPGSPDNPDLCRVYGFLFDLSGAPEEGAVVSAYLPDGISRIGGLIVSPNKLETSTNNLGYFYLDLIPNDQLDDAGTKYEINITRSNGTILRKRISVPNLSNWNLTW